MDDNKAAYPMTDEGWETIEGGPFRFRFKFRVSERDRGPTLEVYGRQGEEWPEVLKFDCFQNAPHWHRVRPDASEDVIQLDPLGMDAIIDFAATQLGADFRTLLTEQGFAELAPAADGAPLRAALPDVERRLRELVLAAASA